MFICPSRLLPGKMVEPKRREIAEEQYRSLESVALRHGMRAVENPCVRGVFDIYAAWPGKPPLDRLSEPYSEGTWVAQAYSEEGKYGVLWDPTLAAVDRVWAEGIEAFIESLASE